MDFTYLKNGESLSLDGKKCVNCGICLEVCPHSVFIHEGKIAIENRERCMECGACELNCPAGAISVNRGVGCASAIIGGMIRGGNAECSCGGKKRSTCCG
jgi:NAD-dependent dihydropyrimidine dehydrogenase PreA subunit